MSRALPKNVRHLILDRDGVLDREPASGWVTDLSQWRWEPGALDALRRLAEAGIRVSVVTNQSCIGRGLATRRQVDALHRAVLREAAEAGGRVAEVYVCPHAPGDGCDCRKPRPGLVRSAVGGSGVPASDSLLVGDDGRDLDAGRAAGVAVALVCTGKGRRTEGTPAADGVPVFDDLAAVVRALTAGATVRPDDAVQPAEAVEVVEEGAGR